MVYKCSKCKKKHDSKDVKYYLVEKASNKPRVYVCAKCHVPEVKKIAKEASSTFLPGAKLGL